VALAVAAGGGRHTGLDVAGGEAHAVHRESTPRSVWVWRMRCTPRDRRRAA
jgi:hypothetical protein